MDRAGGLLVEQDGADEVGDADVGADTDFGEVVGVSADLVSGVLDLCANIGVVDVRDVPVLNLEREFSPSLCRITTVTDRRVTARTDVSGARPRRQGGSRLAGSTGQCRCRYATHGNR